MSRLQVGGLALVIKGKTTDKNIGKVVELIKYVGSEYGGESEWYINCENGLHLINGEISIDAYVEADRLLPLGDQKTQDELRKEELENV